MKTGDRKERKLSLFPSLLLAFNCLHSCYFHSLLLFLEEEKERENQFQNRSLHNPFYLTLFLAHSFYLQMDLQTYR